MISALNLGSDRGSGGQLEDRMRGEAGREAPWADVAPDLLNLFFAVDVDEIDWKLHEKGMDRRTGDNPEASSRWEARASEESFIASGGGIGDLDTGS